MNLEDHIKTFLAQQDDNEKDEWWVTDRELAENVMTKFIQYLAETNINIEIPEGFVNEP